MPTLRQFVDEHTIIAASPLAQSVAKSVQDPVGQTKNDFGKLQKAKLNYDQAREETQRNLAPVQSVISHLSQLHNLDPNQMPIQPPMANGLAPNDPNNQDEQNTQQGYEDDPQGVPTNMNQTIGKMNQTRPSLVGHQPGVAPGFNEAQVVPPKMGVPKPGQGNGGTRAGNPSTQQFGPKAVKPKGSGKMSKGKTVKPSGKNSGGVNITVHSSALPVIKASGTIEKHFGIAALRASSIPVLEATGNMKGAKKGWSTRGKGHLSNTEKAAHYDNMESLAMMPSGGGGGGARQAPGGGMSMHPTGGGGGGPARATGGGMRMPARVGPGAPVGRGSLLSSKNSKTIFPKVEAGPSSLEDKDTDPGTDIAYNPKFEASHKKDCMCSRCMKARKMQARDFSQGRRKKLAKSGDAMPGGGFPIVNKQDLANAKQAIGRAKNPAAARRHINKRAAALGAPPIGQD